MIAIVDYGMGNLRNVQKAVERAGGEAVITSEAETLSAAWGVILPGVGAFGDAMQNLRERRLIEPLRREYAAGKPLLGICLGMQLLFEESEETGLHQGLGLLPGRVVRFPSRVPAGADSSPDRPHVPLRVPHIGWNQLHIRRSSPLLAGVPDGSYVYFAHSYYVLPADDAIVLATTDYGLDFASVVGRGNLFGVQFHPEKSQEVGLQILRNFVQMSREAGGSGQ
jgi:glutamine amidotransferase